MILPSSFVLMADYSVKLAKDIVVGDKLLSSTAKSTQCNTIQKVVQPMVLCNDMNIGSKSQIATWDKMPLYYANPHINKNVFYFKDGTMRKSLIHKFMILEQEQFLSFSTDSTTFIAGPTKFGPFFIFSQK